MLFGRENHRSFFSQRTVFVNQFLDFGRLTMQSPFPIGYGCIAGWPPVKKSLIVPSFCRSLIGFISRSKNINKNQQNNKRRSHPTATSSFWIYTVPQYFLISNNFVGVIPIKMLYINLACGTKPLAIFFEALSRMLE